MSAILSALIGFGSSLLPEATKYLHNKQENDQTLKILEMQIEREKFSLQQRAEEIQTQSEAEVMQAAYNAGNTSGIKWIQGLNDLIRPLIALLIIVDYVMVNFLLISQVSMTGDIIDLPQIADLLWNEEDINGFIIVMTFYFGRMSYKSAMR